MGGQLCFYDGKECPFRGDCDPCHRYPGHEKAQEIRAKKAISEADSLIASQDVLQVDPSQFCARMVMPWNDAVYGYGPTPEVALAQAQFTYYQYYDFAVRYLEHKTQENDNGEE